MNLLENYLKTCFLIKKSTKLLENSRKNEISSRPSTQTSPCAFKELRYPSHLFFFSISPIFLEFPYNFHIFRKDCYKQIKILSIPSDFCINLHIFECKFLEKSLGNVILMGVRFDTKKKPKIFFFFEFCWISQKKQFHLLLHAWQVMFITSSLFHLIIFLLFVPSHWRNRWGGCVISFVSCSLFLCASGATFWSICGRNIDFSGFLLAFSQKFNEKQAPIKFFHFHKNQEILKFSFLAQVHLCVFKTTVTNKKNYFHWF